MKSGQERLTFESVRLPMEGVIEVVAEFGEGREQYGPKEAGESTTRQSLRTLGLVDERW